MQTVATLDAEYGILNYGLITCGFYGMFGPKMYHYDCGTCPELYDSIIASLMETLQFWDILENS